MITCQAHTVEYALEIGNMSVNVLLPNADEQTKAMAIQTLLPILLQMNNSKGIRASNNV